MRKSYDPNRTEGYPYVQDFPKAHEKLLRRFNRVCRQEQYLAGLSIREDKVYTENNKKKSARLYKESKDLYTILSKIYPLWIKPISTYFE